MIYSMIFKPSLYFWITRAMINIVHGTFISKFLLKFLVPNTRFHSYHNFMNFLETNTD
ncbi:hypothetical protein SAMN02927897_00498 [Kosakonia sacchari]|uniref:Uncharacterized protein n=1 Tax=Kosakonia sacchari TaxID=1158459 RepID=A0A1G4XD88_9ENTR|nr:hypothetical protein SAMN02927897_00498 [Kosakonia sacchari]